ncbi:hypothetical protein LWC34_19530 [Kibdelosporangium philippinense]|uniref:SHOCT domain-containing protein n=1 Tax=Kibdelosporangium philippinense TaxID=211113 RepID=A0ABS8ZAV7_9PSEU|nr:hypothetical protein [Kibdelosporangium philippinense]MCE7005001.1 hypothetical protein [Kibdelosporangium philippinense]
MSWQEDLRQLDQALAEGRIHADDYRKRRDQLLATATGATTPPAVSEPASNPFQAQQPPAQQPASDPFQAQQPPSNPFPAQQPPSSNPFPAQQPPSNPFPAQQPPSNPFPAQQPPEVTQVHQPGQQPSSGPFPQAFRWEPTNDSTQVVGQQQAGNPDVTQVVSSQSGGGSEAERTQVVRPVQPPGMQHQAPWQSTPPNPNQGSQWGVEDQPMPSLQPTWLAQGPEVFAEDTKSKGGKTAKILVAVVLVIGLAVGGYFIFAGGSDNNEPGAITPPPTPTQPPTTTVKPRDNLSIMDLPGKVREDYNRITTWTEAQQVKFLTTDEQKIITDAGAGKARMSESATPEDLHPSIFTVETTSAETASATKDKLGEQQLIYGLTAIPNQPTGVLAAKIDKSDKTPAVIRAHYAHKGTLVRIQVTGDDLVTVTELYNDILAEQLKILAANG